MRAIKKINNNVALCVDSAGHQLVAFGKGIGFPAMPYEITNMVVIERTYYDLDERFLPLLNEIPDSVFQLARAVSDRAQRTIEAEFNANLAFTLADHINFCIERHNKNMRLRLPAVSELELRFPGEVEVGRYALQLVQQKLGIALPEAEVAGIAMNIINAEMESATGNVNYNEETITEGIIQIIETYFSTTLNKKSYDYVRLDTHLRYLYARIDSGEPMKTEYMELYEPLRAESPMVEGCVEKVAEYLKQIWRTELGSDERFFLWLHIDRAVKKTEIKSEQ